MAFAMEQLDESERATGSSLLAMSWGVGWSLGPYLGGMIQVRAGYQPLFVMTVVAYSVSLLSIYHFFGKKRRAKSAGG